MQQDVFLNSVQNLHETISEDIQKRKRAANDYVKAHENEMKAGVMKNSGLSEADMKKVQNSKSMTEAEKQEMVNRIMQQNANISMGDAKNLQNMTKEEKEAWAQGHANNQKARAQSNPQHYKARNIDSKSISELLSEQSALSNKLNAMENDLRSKYQAIDNDAEAGKAILAMELKPLYEELSHINDGEGSTKADVIHAEKVSNVIKARQDKFCEKFSPRMLVFIKQAKDSFGNSFSDYDRIEEIQYKITAIQTGTSIAGGQGVNSLQVVGQYLDYLAKAYRY